MTGPKPKTSLAKASRAEREELRIALSIPKRRRYKQMHTEETKEKMRKPKSAEHTLNMATAQQKLAREKRLVKGL